MGLIRQYLKQKVSRSFGGKKADLDQIKKEIKDEITHILYDQTRRTPIVIPVINEIGGGGKPQPQAASPAQKPFKRPAPKQFQPPQVPDTEVALPRRHTENRGY